MRALDRRHGRHAPRGVLLMDLAGAFLPDENMPLAEIQQRRNVLRRDHMAAAEGRALEAAAHGRDVVAQRHANGFFNVDLFHSKNPFSFSPAASGPLPPGITAMACIPIMELRTTLP